MAAVKRHKCTVGPPVMCEPGCYHAARARVLERHLKKLRLELIASVAVRRKMEKAAASKKLAKLEEPREEAPQQEERDPEVLDLVSQFRGRE